MKERGILKDMKEDCGNERWGPYREIEMSGQVIGFALQG